MDYKTPGVFVEELSLIPPSVAAVATAIPAFIGHTARTTGPDGKSLINRPIRLTSLLEFTSLYGGGYTPATITVKLDAQNNIAEVTPVNGRKFFLFDALQHFFDNGGGPCYIVSVGNYTTDVVLGMPLPACSADWQRFRKKTSRPSSAHQIPARSKKATVRPTS